MGQRSFEKISNLAAPNILKPLGGKKRLATFSGIYNKRKGWDLFIEAIQHTKSDFEIVVIGHEENKKNLEKLIKKKIHWMGKFDDDIKISKILNCGDIFLLPSRADALPQTGLEAQSCGLPLVTFNSNGLKDLVDHKIDGFHAEPFNPKSLSVGIDWILQDTKISKKLSENSIIKATNKWDSESEITELATFN